MTLSTNYCLGGIWYPKSVSLLAVEISYESFFDRYESLFTGFLDTAKEIGQLFLESVKLSKEVDSQEAMLGGEFLTLISDLLVEVCFELNGCMECSCFLQDND